MTQVRVVGKTWDYRERLKEMGGHWDASAKNWLFFKLSRSEINELKTMPGCMVVTEQPRHEDTKQGAIDLIKRVLEYERKNETGVDGKNETVIYGDDPTYFNRFKDKNPVSFFGFSSLFKMVEFIEAIPENKRIGERNAGWRDGGKWHGTRDMSEALRIARDGWKEGAEKAAKILDLIGLEHATQRRRAYSVAGGNVSVGRLLAGNPAHMTRRPKQPGRKNITLFVENVASAFVKAEMLVIRASVIAAIADLLEMQGYSCTIIATSNQSHYSAPASQMAVTVKHAGEKLNLEDAIFALGHPSFLRRFAFACVSQADELRHIWASQGSPKPAHDAESLGRNEFYVSVMNENFDGNFLDIAREMLPLLKPEGLPLELELGK